MSEFDGWKYYNHAVIPTTAPHEEPDLTPIINGRIWILGGILARWTTDFDCGYETDWWYCIKDTPFDIETLKAKRRYEINKGLNNCTIEIVDPSLYTKDIYTLTKLCALEYPKKYRHIPNTDEIDKNINNWNKTAIVFLAKDFSNRTVGYAVCHLYDQYVSLSILKVPHQYQKINASAALVYAICNYFLYAGSECKYITDGARNIRHETAFQEYLEKYFGFRKAYCKLYIKYKFPFDLLIKMGRPFCNLLMKSNNKYIYNFYCLIKQDFLKT